MDDKCILEVRGKLKQEDGVDIKGSTLKHIQNEMILNNIPVTTESLYLNCIIDSLDDLKKLDKKLRFYIIGIDGRTTPDPDYWLDRWECLEGDSEEEVRLKYYSLYEDWLYEGEKLRVKVFDVLLHHESPGHWIKRTHFLTGKGMSDDVRALR